MGQHSAKMGQDKAKMLQKSNIENGQKPPRFWGSRRGAASLSPSEKGNNAVANTARWGIRPWPDRRADAPCRRPQKREDERQALVFISAVPVVFSFEASCLAPVHKKAIRPCPQIQLHALRLDLRMEVHRPHASPLPNPIAVRVDAAAEMTLCSA